MNAQMQITAILEMFLTLIAYKYLIDEALLLSKVDMENWILNRITHDFTYEW